MSRLAVDPAATTWLCYNAGMRFAVLPVFALWACSKSSHEGLPPATTWQSEDLAAQAGDMPSKPRGVPSNDPHANMLDDDTQEGGGGGDDDDPHAGVVGAPPLDPTEGQAEGLGSTSGGEAQHGLSTDPSGPVDPAHRIRGVLKLDPRVAARVKNGGAIFLVAKHPNAAGEPDGAPLAVDMLSWQADGQSFELAEPTGLTGDVIVVARYDQDSNADTKEAGDVVGTARVTVPANGVVISLDTVLP